MSFWSFITGTPKIIEAAADTVKSGVNMIDQAFYTDQEKAANQNKLLELWLKLQQLLANDNGVSAIARRAVAFLIMFTFCFLVFFACGIWWINAEWAKFVLQTIENSNLGYLALLVGFFFFGFYAFGKYTKWGTTSVVPEDKKEEGT